MTTNYCHHKKSKQHLVPGGPELRAGPEALARCVGTTARLGDWHLVLSTENLQGHVDKHQHGEQRVAQGVSGLSTLKELTF